MKILQVINCAYRATTEEQDDTIVWLSHAIRGAGADLDVVLSGDAVNYAVEAQNSAGLSFGDWQQTQPPQLARDVASLIEKGVDVYLVDEDVRDRGLGDALLIDGARRIPRSTIATIYDHYDQVWCW